MSGPQGNAPPGLPAGGRNASDGKAPLTLQVMLPDGRSVERRFDGESVVIGRSSKADLSIGDRALSREHARLVADEGAWLVEDLGSRNGSFVNGQAVSGRVSLRPGDVLTVGGTTISIGDGGARPALALVDDGVIGERTVMRPAAELLREVSGAKSAAELHASQELWRYTERLRILNEVHSALGRSIALNELLEMILDRVFDHLKPEEGAIFLKAADGEYYCAASRSIRGPAHRCLYSRHLVREVAEKGLAALVLDTQMDERFAQAASIMTAGVRSLVAAPLAEGSRPLGMIVLGSRSTIREFTESDMELLVSVSSVAALRISNVALAEEAAERRRLEEEVALARRIQVALLPDSLPAPPGYELHALNIPSRGVSGDYYEVIDRLAGRECALHVVDVSGKGIAASLLTASVEALAVAPIEDGLPPADVYTRVSRLLWARTPPEKYATAILAVLEPANGRLHYCNAGHCPALLVRADGAVEWLGSGGPPLGLLPGADYRGGEAVLDEGDLVVLYTDGITEAMNAEDDEFGKQRLAETVVRRLGLPVGELAEAILKELDEFVAGVPYADDRTLLMVRRRAGAHPDA